MTVTCAAWARIPHPLCLTAAQWQVSASMPRGTLPSSRRWRWLPHPSAPPTSLLTENWYLLTNCCQHVSEAERVRAVWTDKKKKRGREMCGKVNVRSPNKWGLMTPRQVSFRCFVADVKNAASPTEGNTRHCENRMMSVKKKSSRKVKVGSSWKCI